jgi:uncharacterized protein (TIGR04255 family)
MNHYNIRVNVAWLERRRVLTKPTTFLFLHRGSQATNRSLCATMSLPNTDALFMAAKEVFPTPLVKQVSFEVRFPNLFFLESRIGEFQVQVMQDFPHSELVHRRNLMMIFAGNAENPQVQELAKQQSGDTEKIWQFKAVSGTRLEISTRNLVLTSENHSSYEGGEKPFRGVIDKAVSEFFKLIQLPTVLRVGLRYINECPIFDKTTIMFDACYNSILPVDRFGLERLSRADCIAVAKDDNVQIQHLEGLRLAPTGDVLVLDLDASTEKRRFQRRDSNH